MAPGDPPEYKIPTESDIRPDGCVLCPKCHTYIKVGKVGIPNLVTRHMPSEQCNKNLKKWKADEIVKKTQQKANLFFTTRTAKVPPTVTAPPRIQSTVHSSSSTHVSQGPALSSSAAPVGCPVAIACLNKLRERIDTLDDSIEEAGLDHPLAGFSGDPRGCVLDGEDAWEKWDGPLNTILQKEPEDLRKLVVRGQRGLAGLHGFLHYLVLHHGIQGALIEGKVERLLSAMDDVMASKSENTTATALKTTPTGIPCPSNSTDSVGVSDKACIDVDALPDVQIISVTSKKKAVPVEQCATFDCEGVYIETPAGTSPYSAYPFELHKNMGDPWDCRIVESRLTVHARGCDKHVSEERKRCKQCEFLTQNASLLRIVDRMRDGIHQNAPFAYHGTGGLINILREKSSQVNSLRLRKLNDARKIVAKSGALEAHKDWIMAVGSGKVERVERLVRSAIAQKRGIRALLKMLDDAAQTVYRTRNYSEEDLLRARLMYRLGGGRVADIAYKSLALPSRRTVRRMSMIPPLISSPVRPTVSEVEANTVSSTTMISEILKSSSVVHQVLMFDEIKVEERPRWDDKTNNILGVCREHGGQASLHYTSKQEVDLLFEKIVDGHVHLASNATVGALGILSEDHRLYSAFPVLISGQCGKESGKDHSFLIRAAIEGTKVSRLRTICLASDGESRRGEAFAILTFKRQLDVSSPIYALLHQLPLMNLEVGDDDLTADKDFKHVFKRIRNLLLRVRGLKVHGIHILPSVIRSHLLENNISLSHVNSVLKPDDKQDVKLAYDLLHEIWCLPSLLSSSPARGPGFQDTREAFRTLGILFRNILMPYICIELSLSEQLIFLSSAAHMLIAMTHEDNAGTLLMPTQLYVDLMIMIKNVYFCVAKAQVDDPLGRFFLILLGTDRLEELFGILRTMVGNDSSVDIQQLVLRLVGTTEVSSILAQHPEWDRAPRHVDHIKPASWKGNVEVAKVNLKTCWLLGRQEIKTSVPRLDRVLQEIESKEDLNINILQPFGKHIVLAKRDLDDYDDTAEDFDNGLPNDSAALEVHPLATELEDAAAEEEPVEKYDPFFDHDGEQVWKARYMREVFKCLKDPESRDRLKRYARIPRYAIKNKTRLDLVESDEATSDIPSVKMNYPLATLLKCDGRLFLCVGEVIDLVFDSKSYEQLSVNLLSEPSAFVQFQILYLIPASIEDDPELKNDWRWSTKRGSSYRVPGRLVEPLNPDISTRTAGRPVYLFDSQTLRAIGSLLLERVTREDGKNIPEEERSPCFPYREENGKLFLLLKSMLIN
ncbi:hypothetical protein GALMADRAFT_1359327 [Galerina marginata CBS 339.88]|uniref:Uncharacterized protein n=1 Tax=Galerina marginata (strain CBS 339.88) TaxID=685588 RepID=A0A067SJ00_GALM3|nr:hypothetical protein GALMADRAFT_1359327 [Galerina marginata CBS 339.88]